MILDKTIDTLRVMLLHLGLLSCVLVANNLAAAEQPTADSRLKLIHTLIEESSSAQQVEKSNNAEARAKRESARSLYRKAVAAGEAGETERMNQMLTDATREMFEAVRLVGHAKEESKDEEKQLRHQLESLSALLNAHERVAREKGVLSQNTELRAKLKPGLVRADALLNQGEMQQAAAILDTAYTEVKQGVRQLRQGDTLVRSLNFATKAEEYAYELDRNDTHKMLVKILLQEKMGTKKIAKRVNPLLKSADKLRLRAERLAKAQEYDKAVKEMENSTREMVRAIRMAGVYIPG